MPTFVSIDFQLSQKLYLIYFAEKQKNVEAAMFAIKVLCCARFYWLKRFYSAKNFFVRHFPMPFLMETVTRLNIGVPAFRVVFSCIFM